MTFRHPDPTPSGASFVLFSSDEPDVVALAEALSTSFTEVDVTAASDSTDRLVTAQLGLDTVFVAIAASAIPDDEALGACHPIWWDDPAPVAGHASHAIVAVRSADEPGEDPRAHALRQSLTATEAVAALLGLPDAVGVYSGPAGATFPPEGYRDLVATSLAEPALPTELWVTTWLEPHDDETVTGYTHGLASFGHADLVIEDSTADPADIYHLLASLAAHIVESGEHLMPGQTLGWESGVLPVAEASDSTDVQPLLAIAL